MGFGTITVNKVRKRLSTSVALSKGGRSKVLTEWEKRYASRLVTVGSLETTICSKSASKRDGCKDVRQYLEECVERTHIVFFYEG